MMIKRLAMPLFVVGTAALTFFLFRTWGLAGPAILIALFGLSWLGFLAWHRHAQRRIRETFARIPEHQRATALAALSESERAEVLEALKPKT